MDQSLLYFTHRLSSGLSVSLLPAPKGSKAVYCGVAILAGSRDDAPEKSGLAHFVEHMIFKGTTRRKSWHILNRMEVVGGELNAYTTKEETFVYTVAPSNELARSVELLSDLVRHATFPEVELVRERKVVVDEINLYKDNPSDQIYDDFESLLFPDHPLGRPILGSCADLMRITAGDCHLHARTMFQPGRMHFFCMGDLPFSKLIRLCERAFGEPFETQACRPDPTPPSNPPPFRQSIKRDNHRQHTIVGGFGPSLYDSRRLLASFLMNYLGGSGMNARLNVVLREKNGWAYSVEASHTALSDVGWWEIYFGCDPEDAPRAIEALFREFERLVSTSLSLSVVRSWIKQLRGQLLLLSENSETLFLNFGKQMLHFAHYQSPESTAACLDTVSGEALRAMAATLFAPDNLHQLSYTTQ